VRAKDNAEALRTRRFAEAEREARRRLTQRAQRTRRLAETNLHFAERA